ncbi:MAG: hypothetical protein IT368_08255 [Candidatus Hydrogenedentes bacterium]|nr:hypothetical protein [Candidatus Hydrogenedentota bacterium]
MASLVNVYPGLKSEELITELFERPLQLLAPGFDDIHTFTDERDAGRLLPPHIGIGRVLSPNWSWFIQGGWSAATLRTKQDAWTLLGLPIHNDFAITRGALYAGIGLDFFPLGMPEQRKYQGIWDRVRNTKPNAGWRLTWTRAWFDADIKLGFGTGQGPNFLSLKLDDEWNVLSSNLVVGADMPLTKYHQLSVNAGYAYFWERAVDFKGPVITIGWKYFFH